MIVTLTHAQVTGVRARISDFHRQALDSHNERHSRTKRSFDLPAIAWRQILDALVKQCYGPMGGKLKDRGRPADSTYRAIATIADGIRRIESHPALRGASVEGWVGDVIPAWAAVIIGDGLRATSLGDMSPYPVAEREFRLLVPRHIENLKMRVTVWDPERVESYEPSGPRFSWAEIGQWTFSAFAHEMFVGRSADPQRHANRGDVEPVVVGEVGS